MGMIPHDLAETYNPAIRDLVNNYGAFHESALSPTLCQIDRKFALWALRWLQRIASQDRATCSCTEVSGAEGMVKKKPCEWRPSRTVLQPALPLPREPGLRRNGQSIPTSAAGPTWTARRDERRMAVPDPPLLDQSAQDVHERCSTTAIRQSVDRDCLRLQRVSQAMSCLGESRRRVQHL